MAKVDHSDGGNCGLDDAEGPGTGCTKGELQDVSPPIRGLVLSFERLRLICQVAVQRQAQLSAYHGIAGRPAVRSIPGGFECCGENMVGRMIADH